MQINEEIRVKGKGKGRVYKLCLKLSSEWDCQTESDMSFQILGAQ